MLQSMQGEPGEVAENGASLDYSGETRLQEFITLARSLHSQQIEKEVSLLKSREALSKSIEERKKPIFADKIVGKISEAQAVRREMDLMAELVKFDQGLFYKLEDLRRSQQMAFQKAGFHGFEATEDKEKIAYQIWLMAPYYTSELFISSSS